MCPIRQVQAAGNRRNYMAKVILGTTMSLDGFIADRNGDLSPLYPDLEELRNTEMLQESMRNTGAVVMGRRAYDLAQGDLTGYEYQVPIFVVTHEAPKEAPKGQNDKLSVTFVTEGVESAIERAKAAAGEKDVTIVGGANTAQQLLRARLVDEIEIGIMPLLLGQGLRFFEHLDDEQFELERTRVIESGARVDMRFRVVK
jgi:dihydrofolate reductase